MVTQIWGENGKQREGGSEGGENQITRGFRSSTRTKIGRGAEKEAPDRSAGRNSRGERVTREKKREKGGINPFGVPSFLMGEDTRGRARREPQAGGSGFCEDGRRHPREGAGRGGGVFRLGERNEQAIAGGHSNVDLVRGPRKVSVM